MATSVVAGVGFGGRGCWLNRHFTSLELAVVEYDRQLAELRRVYASPGYQWTGKYVEEPIVVDSLIRGVQFVPLTKAGKRGKRVWTLHLYAIPAQPRQENLQKSV